MDRISILKRLSYATQIASPKSHSVVIMIKDALSEGKHGENRQFIYKIIKQGTRKELLTILLENCEYDSYFLIDATQNIKEIEAQLKSFPEYGGIFYLPKTEN